MSKRKMRNTVSNPLLNSFNTTFGTPPFHLFEPDMFLPAIDRAISLAKGDIQFIRDSREPASFENTIEALEFSGLKVERISSIFFNLNAAETNEKIQEVAREFSPKLSAFKNDVQLDEALFERIRTVWDQKDRLNLDAEQRTLLENTYLGFVRNGALLTFSEKETLREIDAELAGLSLKFGENVLADTNEFTLHLDNPDFLTGLPESVMEAGKLEAGKRGFPGYMFTLDYPSYVPFMTYADNRMLREQMYKAFASRAFHEDELDNRDNVARIVSLRHKRANLLGFKTHADFVLERRMAENPQNVHAFLEEMMDHAGDAARRDFQRVESLALEDPEIERLERWDWAYYAEKLKKRDYDFDDETLKPYFELERVIKGVFKTAEKLYGLRFNLRKDIPVYHHDVKAYEVLDENGEHLSIFFADFHPRKGKRAGAWMTSYRNQYVKGKNEYRPQISIVCNFTKPTAGTPSLLSFNEVTTLFHEFGHALHGMLAKGRYPSITGTGVFWDFVELPSQIMENWCYEKECLDLFAEHYKTGQKIPLELVEKLKAAATFNEGYATMRQLSFGILDMGWHGNPDVETQSVDRYEKEILSQTELFPGVEGTNMSVAFSHIFQGGYSAGYYSYKWAEVLDADAFEHFKETGIFNPETAKSFRDNILSKGGSEHPMILYRRFRGKDPDTKALLRRSGLIEAIS